MFVQRLGNRAVRTAEGQFGGEYFANRLTRDLFRFAYELQNFGVTFTPKRSNGRRLLLLNYDKNSDSSDGKKLMPEWAMKQLERFESVEPRSLLNDEVDFGELSETIGPTMISQGYMNS